MGSFQYIRLMNENLVAENIEDKKLFVSARAFTFIVQNTMKVASSLNVSQFEKIVSKVSLDEMNNNPKIEIKVVSDFIRVCQGANFSEDDFYMLGNKIHEFHYSWLAKLFKFNIGFDMPIINDVSFIKIDHRIEAGIFFMQLSINEILLLNYREIFTPFLNIVHGFVDRLLKTFLNEKPIVEKTKSSLEITYKRRFDSSFDIAQYISNEQFFFSRLKSSITIEEKGMKSRVQFFLFKDISFSIDEIAVKLEMTVRALQRKLKEEGSSFRMIKENIRRELSQKYLSDATLSIQEISELLAYSERSVFEKAFKKWYGVNPKVFRER